MDLSTEQKLQALLQLPWTIALKRDAEDGHLVVRVAELPDAIGTGATEKEVHRDLWEALYVSLGARLDNGDPIPLPPGQVLPWERKAGHELRRIQLPQRRTSGAWQVRPVGASGGATTLVGAGGAPTIKF